MFKSRKSTPPQISPLAPSPAVTQSMHVNGTGGRLPTYNAGDPMDRAGSYNSDSIRKDKTEKRRSGFFGLGKKDKDKEVVREKNVSWQLVPIGSWDWRWGVEPSQVVVHNHSLVTRGNALLLDSGGDRDPRLCSHPVAPIDYLALRHQINQAPRQSSSFTVERPNPSQPHVAPPPSQDFQPHAMHRYPDPKGHAPPTPHALHAQHLQQQPQMRNVSSPADGAPSDLAPSTSMPKSQSMGFNRPASVPETHPYRGYLKAQQEKQMQAEAQAQQQQQQGTLPRSQSMPLNDANGHAAPPLVKEIESPRGGPPAQAAWMKEFDAVVELIGAQPQKTYVASPPELEMILARTSAGGQPKQGQPGSASNDWDSVWLQLSGISLSMWSMKETRAAASKGEKVPPTYFNITDSSLELLAPLPPPPHRPTSHPHHFVFSLNTAGSNRLLFSSPSERDLARWATGLRVAAWERARLEEIYTGHLIQSGGREPKSDLVGGRLEGWVRVRVMGGTDWKRLWAVLHQPGMEESKEDEKKARRRSFFGKVDKESVPIQEPNTGVSMASFYLEPRTPKNKTMPAVLTITNITQAYAVFPERLEVMAQSNLMKVIGRVGGELVTIEGRLRDSGWALMMPESPGEGTASPPPSTPLANMMRWVTGFHDVFGLYGRPQRYAWDQSDPKSLFFAYPHGEEREQLFLDIEEALASDFRTSSLAAIRSQFVSIVQRKMQGPAAEYGREDDEHPTPRPEGSYRLPPLSFHDPSPQSSDHSAPRSLTPITERTDLASRTNSTRTAKSNFLVNERQLSQSSSKQNSGGSMKHPSTSTAGQEDRLAPIEDSTEAMGHSPEEPIEESTADPEERGTPTPPGVTPTTAESGGTAPTTWSRSTGDTPTQSRVERAEPIHAQPQQVPVPIRTSPLPGPEHGLPDLPSTTSTNGPLLGRIISSPTRSDPHVLSPTPRRVSMGEVSPVGSPIHDEPAAMYLMNMVERDPPPPAQQDPAQPAQTRDLTPERARPSIVTSLDTSSHQKYPSDSLARKPSGARAPPPPKMSGSRSLEAIGDEDRRGLSSATTQPDLGEDVSAYVAYADQPSPAKPMAEAKALSPPPVQEDGMRSSFALSKSAAERRAKAEQAAADQQRTMSMPGGGKRTAGAETWSGSDEEEDEEESPVVTTRSTLPPPRQPRQASPEQPVQRVLSQTRALPAIPRAPEIRMPNGDGHRNSLPQAPTEQPRSRSPAQQQQQPSAPNRQTVWNANFSADHGMAENKSGKFVELEQPSEQLTKAFAPHGLLQAGMQNKEDRSAKKQEELAREMGSSLINVPSKPPPPQTGLLGAVAAHERDRKNAGGIGATLTDRERERRQGEDRQQEMEKLQRQQMEQMSQYGGNNMYGGQYPYGMNMPMMGMPGMPGMQRMPMGYNPYQGGYNPYAQQQAMMAAQMAYHQAMMSMSQQGGGGSHSHSHSPERSSSPSGSMGRHSSPPPMPGYYSPSPYGHGTPQGHSHMSIPPFGWPGMGQMPWGSPSPPPGPGSPHLEGDRSRPQTMNPDPRDGEQRAS